ncbi:phage baseplate assembly protein V [Grimontia hollisae]|uniref:phage baseplate assembly protein V n=1 Tax=Grimontia hollisae TaxID=673 RepID=UPI001303F160|nr:phage baseplate assembly protein V [Grimontia hollisae]
MLYQLVQRIESLEDEVIALRETLEAQGLASANLIRLAVVEKADAQTVDVKTGDNKATGIPFFVHCAGRVSHYRRPSVGEQCILINLGSGDNLNNSVALMGLPSTTFKCPTTQENEVMTDYGGGMTERYHLNSGKLTAHYPGGVEMHAPSFKNHGEIIDHTRSMQADRDIYNVHTHSSPETGAPTASPGQKQ